MTLDSHQHQGDTDSPPTRNLRKATGNRRSTVPRSTVHSRPPHEKPAFEESNSIYLETKRTECIYLWPYYTCLEILFFSWIVRQTIRIPNSKFVNLELSCLTAVHGSLVSLFGMWGKVNWEDLCYQVAIYPFWHMERGLKTENQVTTEDSITLSHRWFTSQWAGQQNEVLSV